MIFLAAKGTNKIGMNTSSSYGKSVHLDSRMIRYLWIHGIFLPLVADRKSRFFYETVILGYMARFLVILAFFFEKLGSLVRNERERHDGLIIFKCSLWVALLF